MSTIPFSRYLLFLLFRDIIINDQISDASDPHVAMLGLNDMTVFAGWQSIIKFAVDMCDLQRAFEKPTEFPAFMQDILSNFANPDRYGRHSGYSYIRNAAAQLARIRLDYNPALQVSIPTPPAADYRRFISVMDNAEKNMGVHADSIAVKERGNAAFKDQKYKRAIKLYNEALQQLYIDIPTGGSCERNIMGQMIPIPRCTWRFVAVVYSNMAQCYLQLDDKKSAAKAAELALRYDPTNEKAKYRLAVAREPSAEPQAAADGNAK